MTLLGELLGQSNTECAQRNTRANFSQPPHNSCSGDDRTGLSLQQKLNRPNPSLMQTFGHTSGGAQYTMSQDAMYNPDYGAASAYSGYADLSPPPQSQTQLGYSMTSNAYDPSAPYIAYSMPGPFPGAGQQQSAYAYEFADLNVTPFDPSAATNQMDAGVMYGMPGAYPNNSYTVGAAYPHSSPAGSSHTSTGSDDSEDLYGHGYKRSPPGAEFDLRGRRGRHTKKRKPKRDPNEPQKPVSAYALFFRDTQAAIKGQNPNASFGEVSKIVASMWDSLDAESKNLYKQKTEVAKKDYLKQLAAYRASLVSKGGNPSSMETFAEFTQAQRKYSGQPGLPGATQSSPDSTTGVPAVDPSQTINECGGKSLASLIAEPSPQHVLTATTTLTVPQSYMPARMKSEADSIVYNQMNGPAMCVRSSCPNGAIENPQWDAEYCSNDCVVTHCRDVFNSWVQTQPAHPGAYAPV